MGEVKVQTRYMYSFVRTDFSDHSSFSSFTEKTFTCLLTNKNYPHPNSRRKPILAVQFEEHPYETQSI